MLKQVGKTKPGYPSSYLNRATANMGLHQLNEALDDCNECINIIPNWQAAYVLRASVYDKLGKKNLAQNDRQNARELSKP